MRYRRTLLVVGLWLIVVGLCAVTWAQEAAGPVELSEKTKFSLGSVVLLLGVAAAAWAVKADVRSVREALDAHSRDCDSHHRSGELENQFVLRREHDVCFGTVQASLRRIEEMLTRRE
jgi:hypothetical protein